MLFTQAEITIKQVRYADLKILEDMFTREFGGELDSSIIRQRIHRLHQFYFLLLPLRQVSPWIKNFFTIYIIRVRGHIAGFLQISYLNHRQIHLDYFTISKHYRGQGIGSQVLQKFLAEAADQQGHDVVLEVRTDNPAYRLYRRLGFSSQAQVIHYSIQFPNTGADRPVEALDGFRVLQPSDRPQLFGLYRASISRRLQRFIRRCYREFNPSLFIRNLEWIKNRLMHNTKREYVLIRDDRTVASLDIRSYEKSHTHFISMMLHPAYEKLRGELLGQVLTILQAKYGQGTAYTTVYDDMIDKQQALERMGFVRQDTYYVMLRPMIMENFRNGKGLGRPVPSKQRFTLHRNDS
ncbi:hypothetical protein P22_2607 [Propionispora sp. 2/2-37]|uniref:GNAT family N-acetyltransferase n=1 Tax=Propionispora sp. 2/2-37 TaxID=1677858 RepID=UPI0006BB797A|nr:GNAT family N-acetyltransferase [Propionispora sp. 2/2-37]CUH96517.1 hypothetical protein P22_2607 [Propionispora sp. 2/2-37]